MKKKFIIPVLMLGTLLCMMDVSVMTILLPEIQGAFNQSLDNLSWTINVYTIVFATLIIPFGRLAEKVGQDKFVFAGLIVFGIGSLLSGSSTNLPFMLFARFIQSVGAAAIIPTSMVIGISQANQKNRNKVVAALAGAQGLAVALGPSMGGFVAQYWSWKWVFWINVPLVILDLAIFAMILPLTHEKTNPVKIDYIGSLLSMIMLFSLSLGLVRGNDWDWHSTTIVSLFVVAIVSFIFFIIFETKSKHPMIDMKLFKSRNFDGAGISLIVAQYLLGGLVALIPTFLTRVQGMSELDAALMITPYSISVMLSVIIFSLLVRKINNKLLIGAGLIIIAISYYMMANLNLDQNYNQLIIGDIVLGVGYGMIVSTSNILAVSDFKGSLLTESQSVANVFRQVGLVLAIAIFMTILSGNIKTAKQNTLNYGQNQVENMNLASNVKHKINHKLEDKLNPNSTKVNNVNHQVQMSKIHVSQSAIDRKINLIYNQKLALLSKKTGIPVAQIPTPVKTKLASTIDQKVNQAVRQKVNRTQHDADHLVSKVKHHAKTQMKHAFLNVYQVMIWVPIISLLVVPIFKFRKKRNRVRKNLKVKAMD
ncbi:MFS transporter [Philodulcilactobacillus myokoensis]|uniref:MFS transporter n=1 Tax=Philodulcilactobacillus myokoensis TaxID=2929573 RepID=A0A9W6ERD6_9LACO|nr:MFS transporter [Philodulcilactobacillus myokoensis]GLB46085.1 MFS transporter [Philodulcilactobacillus myokoensis]